MKTESEIERRAVEYNISGNQYPDLNGHHLRHDGYKSHLDTGR